MHQTVQNCPLSFHQHSLIIAEPHECNPLLQSLFSSVVPHIRDKNRYWLLGLLVPGCIKLIQNLHHLYCCAAGMQRYTCPTIQFNGATYGSVLNRIVASLKLVFTKQKLLKENKMLISEGCLSVDNSLKTKIKGFGKKSISVQFL